jgi:hypothetical protein
VVKPCRHRRSLSRLLAAVALVLDLAWCAVAVGVGAARPAAVAVVVVVVVVSGQAVRSLRDAGDAADVTAVSGLLAGISAGISAVCVICSAALKAEQRAFALAGAGLAGEQQALAWIPGIMPRSALVNSAGSGTSRGWARPMVLVCALSAPHLGERKSQ